MKTISFTVILNIFFLQIILGQNSLKSDDAPYKSGEKLIYKMEYGFITGGLASLVLNEKEIDGKTYNHVVATGKTIGMADKIFGVLDIYESYFDKNSALPVKHIRSIKEGDYKRYDVAFFNYNNSEAYSSSAGKVSLPVGTMDVISMFYYARLNKSFESVKLGDFLTFNTFFHEEYWKMQIRFAGYETIKLDIGKIKCLKFKPIVEEGTFKNPEALTLYISADANHIPIRCEMDFFVGSFRTDLAKFEGLKTPLVFER